MFRLKTLCRALCLATGLIVSAGAATAATPLSAIGGTATQLLGSAVAFNPDWFDDASSFARRSASSFDLSSMLMGASLLLTQPANVTYTLVGFEAGFNNAFVSGGEQLNNRGGSTSRLGTSMSFSHVTASPLDFGFLSNGSGALFGNGSSRTGLVMSNDGQSALILFNDLYSGDRDFDDMVIRVSISAVPEPEMLGMLLAGLCLVAAGARRRVKRMDLLAV